MTPAITFCLGFRSWDLGHLHRCLLSLAQFQRPAIVTVLDDELPIIWTARHDEPLMKLRWLLRPRAVWSRAYALNCAVRAAETPYVCLTDADMLFPASWLAVAERFLRPNRLMLTDSRDLDESTTRGLAESYVSSDQSLEEASQPHDRVGQGAAMVVPRAWFESVHGFDEQMQVWGAEDNDLVLRARLDGLIVGWLPDTFVVHQWHRRDWCTEDQWKSVVRNREILSERIRDRGPIVVNSDGWGEGRAEMTTSRTGRCQGCGDYVEADPRTPDGRGHQVPNADGSLGYCGPIDEVAVLNPPRSPKSDRLAELEVERDALAAALLALRDHEELDGPCWCWMPLVLRGPHGPACLQARTALAGSMSSEEP